MENKIVNVQPLEGVGTEDVKLHSFINLKVDKTKLFLTFQLVYYAKVDARNRSNRSLGDLQSRHLGLVEEKFRCFYRESNLGLHGYTVMCTTKTNRKKTTAMGSFTLRQLCKSSIHSASITP